MSKLRQKQRASKRIPNAPLSDNRAFARAMAYLQANYGRAPQIEASIPACLIWSVARAISDDKRTEPSEKEFVDAIIGVLRLSAMEPFADMQPEEAVKAFNCAYSLAVNSYENPEGGRKYGTMFIASVLWLNSILETEYLVLSPSSSFEHAATALIDDLNKARESAAHAHKFAKLEKAAEKLSRRMQERFERVGLFGGATLPAAVQPSMQRAA
ncbi:hypothetical protein ACHMW5_13555 [Azospirillum melinis]|uniref:hypothetical protein n=1 Tax=Azospirillum melinis TaxID=328839 RepID=UPI0037579A98